MSSQPSANDRTSTLVRALLSLLFLFIYAGLLVFLGLVSALGLLIALVSGKRPPIALTRAADRMVCYSGQIANYLIWVDGEAPFPFSPLPPASDLFTRRLEGASSGYAGARDPTINSISGSSAASIDGDTESAMDLEPGEFASEQKDEGETSQLNSNKDPEALLDDTVVPSPRIEETGARRGR